MTEQFLHTNYIGSYKSSTYAINTALMFLKDYLNKEFIMPMIFDLQKLTAGYFGWNQTNLGYNEGYLSLGFTLDFQNSTFFDEPKPPKKITLTEEHSPAFAYEELITDAREKLHHERSDGDSKGFLKAASERWLEAGGVRYWVEDDDRDLKSE